MENQKEFAKVPHHIAIIMDGNGRWAENRKQPRFYGHKVGVDAAEKVIRICTRIGVKTLTLFAFSSENWHRPSQEVDVLMGLFKTVLSSKVTQFQKQGICFRAIGDRSKFSKSLQEEINRAEILTANNKKINLIIAANYGGRWDITQAAKQIAISVKTNLISPDMITSEFFSKHLATEQFSEPDLFIRTGGEKRISNFLLWQLAYTEFYFTDTLWPDFSESDLILAIDDFSRRERRFGQTSKQIVSEPACSSKD
ncbi:isoprenyl transferase [Candidatus Nitrosacidococcus sp. I8]|uniref:isoprenyl transferase n=1 Tax=Candidatus Nitrosacidococcus sp. I8 TaxID=2942908 RepID=UPI002226AB35|nr:isoprenyl transferase [Candidatus Nitrosacidococcus sp. I8]CAH9017457.1 Ditrans,polycis-undecaprenyl-diphosphate synthase ((2E,6E)-farnesyl-diphosphate specific) [Candidatus Nitrosacidococcus sp. I8]